MEPPSIVISCPACGRATGRVLLGASAGTWGVYFHCDPCHHTWFVTRDNVNDWPLVSRDRRVDQK